MLAEVRRMRDEPIAADALGKRRTLLVGAFGRQVETTNGLGNFLASLAVQGLPMSDYARYIPSLQAVTPAQVTAAVAAEIDPAQASIVIVGRASEFLEALRAQHPERGGDPDRRAGLRRGEPAGGGALGNRSAQAGPSEVAIAAVRGWPTGGNPARDF